MSQKATPLRLLINTILMAVGAACLVLAGAMMGKGEESGGVLMMIVGWVIIWIASERERPRP